jgi:hypothetical protein
MAPEVLTTLIGRLPKMQSPAFLPAIYSRHPVVDQVYPGVIQRVDNVHIESFSTTNILSWEDVKSLCVEGIVLSELSPAEMKVFNWYEDDDYTRSTVPVLIHNGEGIESINTDVYIWSAGNELLDLDSSWSYERFRSTKLDLFLDSTVRPCKMEIDRLGL